MSSPHWFQHQKMVMAALLLLLILGCGPVARLQELNRQRRAIATGAAIIDENKELAAEAYANIRTLPGYRLESRRTTHDSGGRTIHEIVIREHDTQGNRHTVTQTPEGRQYEVYEVGGQSYVYDSHYEGWLNTSTISATQTGQLNDALLTGSDALGRVVQLLTQFGTVPTRAGRERLNDRAVTRYELQYLIDEIAEAFGQPRNSAIELRGTIWVDEVTGALLKSEMLLYEDEAGRPAQEFLLEITKIGDVPPISVPAPLVDPVANAAATATAQSWSVMKAAFDYEGERISFELIPVRVTQVPDSSPRSAEMQLFLRQLPAHFFLETDLEPFLVQLRQRLFLSIPKRNLVITSSGYRLEESDSQEERLEVIFLFNADLEDFSHVELMVSQPGNPSFAPVAVE